MTTPQSGYEIEQVSLPNSEALSFHDYLGLIHQAHYEFRTHHNKPQDPERPIVHSYTSDGSTVTIVSYSEQRVEIQVTSNEGIRTGYSYNDAESHPLIVDLYEDAATDKPTAAVALVDAPGNESLLLDIHDYLYQGTAKSR